MPILILNLLAGLVVLARGLSVLNHMCPRTSHGVRATWLLLTVGAAAMLLQGGQPAWPDVALHWGVAALVCAARRDAIVCAGRT